MTLAEKLRFLADRIEDGKEFRFVGQTYIRYFDEGGQQFVKTQNGKDLQQGAKLKTILANELEFVPKWEFTEDEKVILINLPAEHQWIARDEILQGLYAYTSKPTKREHSWADSTGGVISLTGFRHLFESIQWEDDEPCEFRRYI